ncbi:aminotransferase class I/II-fold pyridoxal phosphate-dependent enzyme [Nocardia sp. BMG51109]|uniref:aminotransferase class I/II-fold pyridoxal phosphate-dependent enzyme n=1 Tax=Nocardia sp. BMG51109 TaxID=1056816 RepID=UPI0004654821|nr:aminotransferase class I/II-fold pyridoxal phosphate-dependent enzyme [Nocardia sp. BMG51109]
MAALDESSRARTITISGLSKTSGVADWRLGYAAAPAHLAVGIANAVDLLAVCAPTPLQDIAITALDLPAPYYDAMRADLGHRKDVVATLFSRLGLTPNSRTALTTYSSTARR